jgi:hypothetical protein
MLTGIIKTFSKDGEEDQNASPPTVQYKSVMNRREKFVLLGYTAFNFLSGFALIAVFVWYWLVNLKLSTMIKSVNISL